jgi:hypothetical protein
MIVQFHSEISLDWLEAEYVYQPKPVISNAPKEWSIADIDDSDWANVKVKADSKAIKEKKAKMKTQIKAMKGMIK